MATAPKKKLPVAGTANGSYRGPYPVVNGVVQTPGPQQYTPTLHATPPPGMTTGGGSPAPTQPANGPAPVLGAPGGAPNGGAQSTGTPFAGVPGLPSLYSSINGNHDYEDLEDEATGGTINSFNTAANRLRERLDSSTQGQAQTAQNRALSRGVGNSGINDAQQAGIQSSGQQNYAQGINDLSNQFESQRQQGLQTALGAVNGATSNSNFMDNQLVGLINSDRGRQNNIDLANTNNAAAASRQNSQQSWQGTQNQLGYQNSNWQDVFNQLMGQYGQGAMTPPNVSTGTPSIGVGGFAPTSGPSRSST